MAIAFAIGLGLFLIQPTEINSESLPPPAEAISNTAAQTTEEIKNQPLSSQKETPPADQTINNKEASSDYKVFRDRANLVRRVKITSNVQELVVVEYNIWGGGDIPLYLEIKLKNNGDEKIGPYDSRTLIIIEAKDQNGTVWDTNREFAGHPFGGILPQANNKGNIALYPADNIVQYDVIIVKK